MKKLSDKKVILMEILLFFMLIFITTGCDIINGSKSEKTYDNNNEKEEIKVSSKPIYKFDAEFSDIKRIDGKVNIYVFWGDGCPHCSALHNYLDSLTDIYGEYFNLYGFEIWYNNDNSEMAQQFATAMGDELRGVPYFIIGEKSFSGYAESYNQEIIDTIKEESNKSYDVYFDVIKKNG